MKKLTLRRGTGMPPAPPPPAPPPKPQQRQSHSPAVAAAFGRGTPRAIQIAVEDIAGTPIATGPRAPQVLTKLRNDLSGEFPKLLLQPPRGVNPSRWIFEWQEAVRMFPFQAMQLGLTAEASGIFNLFQNRYTMRRYGDLVIGTHAIVRYALAQDDVRAQNILVRSGGLRLAAIPRMSVSDNIGLGALDVTVHRTDLSVTDDTLVFV